MSAHERGKLVICPTPIGNLGDVTTRVRDTLRIADRIYAEDTRVTGKLLHALGITNRLERLDENTLDKRATRLLEQVGAGELVAYCSDAGMPGISDPGLRLVAAARDAGAPVEVLPGPSAVDTAFVASGFTCSRFYFGGFLPRKSTELTNYVRSLATLDAALIFYESPRRIVTSLRGIAEIFPYRSVAVCRELTKLHEEVVRGPVEEVLHAFSQREAAETEDASMEKSVRGELVIVIDGPSDAEHNASAANAREQAQQRARKLLTQGFKTNTIVKTLVTEFAISRNVAYSLVVELSR